MKQVVQSPTTLSFLVGNVTISTCHTPKKYWAMMKEFTKIASWIVGTHLHIIYSVGDSSMLISVFHRVFGPFFFGGFGGVGGNCFPGCWPASLHENNWNWLVDLFLLQNRWGFQGTNDTSLASHIFKRVDFTMAPHVLFFCFSVGVLLWWVSWLTIKVLQIYPWNEFHREDITVKPGQATILW